MATLRDKSFIDVLGTAANSQEFSNFTPEQEKEFFELATNRFIEDNLLDGDRAEEVRSQASSFNKQLRLARGNDRVSPSNDFLAEAFTPYDPEASQEDRLDQLAQIRASLPEKSKAYDFLNAEDLEYNTNLIIDNEERKVRGENVGAIGDLFARAGESAVRGLIEGVGPFFNDPEEIEEFANRFTAGNFAERYTDDPNFLQNLSSGAGSLVGSLGSAAGGAAIAGILSGGNPIAAGAGAVAGSLGFNANLRFQEGFQTEFQASGDTDAAVDAGFSALPAAAIDVVGDKILLGKAGLGKFNKALKNAKTAKEKAAILKEALKLRRTKDVLTGFASEGITESLGDLAAGLGIAASTGREEAIPTTGELAESFAIGGILGGGFSAVGSTIGTARIKNTVNTIESESAQLSKLIQEGKTQEAIKFIGESKTLRAFDLAETRQDNEENQEDNQGSAATEGTGQEVSEQADGTEGTPTQQEDVAEGDVQTVSPEEAEKTVQDFLILSRLQNARSENDYESQRKLNPILEQKLPNRQRVFTQLGRAYAETVGQKPNKDFGPQLAATKVMLDQLALSHAAATGQSPEAFYAKLPKIESTSRITKEGSIPTTGVPVFVIPESSIEPVTEEELADVALEEEPATVEEVVEPTPETEQLINKLPETEPEAEAEPQNLRDKFKKRLKVKLGLDQGVRINGRKYNYVESLFYKNGNLKGVIVANPEGENFIIRGEDAWRIAKDARKQAGTTQTFTTEGGRTYSLGPLFQSEDITEGSFTDIDKWIDAAEEFIEDLAEDGTIDATVESDLLTELYSGVNPRKFTEKLEKLNANNLSPEQRQQLITLFQSEEETEPFVNRVLTDLDIATQIDLTLFGPSEFETRTVGYDGIERVNLSSEQAEPLFDLFKDILPVGKLSEIRREDIDEVGGYIVQFDMSSLTKDDTKLEVFYPYKSIKEKRDPVILSGEEVVNNINFALLTSEEITVYPESLFQSEEVGRSAPKSKANSKFVSKSSQKFDVTDEFLGLDERNDIGGSGAAWLLPNGDIIPVKKGQLHDDISIEAFPDSDPFLASTDAAVNGWYRLIVEKTRSGTELTVSGVIGKKPNRKQLENLRDWASFNNSTVTLDDGRFGRPIFGPDIYLQPGEGKKRARGALTFNDTGIPKLMRISKESGDPTTFHHELAHVIRITGILADIVGPKGMNDIAQNLKLEKKDGEYVWDRKAEEKFADEYERWLRSPKQGEARKTWPAALEKAFDTVREIFLKIYSAIRGTNIVNPTLRENFEKLYQVRLSPEEFNLLISQNQQQGVGSSPSVEASPETNQAQTDEGSSPSPASPEDISNGKTVYQNYEDLPPIPEGHIRLLHKSSEGNIKAIQTEGLKYRGAIYETTHAISSPEQLDLVGGINGQWAAGNQLAPAVVFDVPFDVNDQHSSRRRFAGQAPPGVLSPDYIVGVIPRRTPTAPESRLEPSRQASTTPEGQTTGATNARLEPSRQATEVTPERAEIIKNAKELHSLFRSSLKYDPKTSVETPLFTELKDIKPALLAIAIKAPQLINKLKAIVTNVKNSRKFVDSPEYRENSLTQARELEAIKGEILDAYIDHKEDTYGDKLPEVFEENYTSIAEFNKALKEAGEQVREDFESEYLPLIDELLARVPDPSQIYDNLSPELTDLYYQALDAIIHMDRSALSPGEQFRLFQSLDSTVNDLAPSSLFNILFEVTANNRAELIESVADSARNRSYYTNLLRGFENRGDDIFPTQKGRDAFIAFSQGFQNAEDAYLRELFKFEEWVGDLHKRTIRKSKNRMTPIRIGLASHLTQYVLGENPTKNIQVNIEKARNNLQDLASRKAPLVQRAVSPEVRARNSKALQAEKTLLELEDLLAPIDTDSPTLFQDLNQRVKEWLTPEENTFLEETRKWFFEQRDNVRFIKEAVLGEPMQGIVQYMPHVLVGEGTRQSLDSYRDNIEMSSMDVSSSPDFIPTLGKSKESGRLKERTTNTVLPSGLDYVFNINYKVHTAAKAILYDIYTLPERKILNKSLTNEKVKDALTPENLKHLQETFAHRIGFELGGFAEARAISNFFGALYRRFSGVILSAAYQGFGQFISPLSFWITMNPTKANLLIPGFRLGFEARRDTDSAAHKLIRNNAPWLAHRNFAPDPEIQSDRRVNLPQTELEKLSAGTGRVLDKLNNNVLFFGIKLGDLFSAEGLFFTEYIRVQLKNGRYKTVKEVIDNLDKPNELDIRETKRELEKNIAPSQNNQRGFFFSHKNGYLSALRIMILPFASHRVNAMNETWNSLKNTMTRVEGMTIKERAKALQTIGAFGVQAASFMAVKHYINFLIGLAAFRMIKDAYNSEDDEKLTEVEDAIVEAKRNKDKGKQQVLEQELEVLKNVRRLVKNYKQQHMSSSSFKKNLFKDILGNTFYPFAFEPVANWAGYHLHDLPNRKDFQTTKEEAIKLLKKQSKLAKTKEERRLIERQIEDVRSQQQINMGHRPFEFFDTFGTFGSIIDPVETMLSEGVSALFDDTAEFSANDLALAFRFAGVGQADIVRFLRLQDRIEREAVKVEQKRIEAEKKKLSE